MKTSMKLTVIAAMTLFIVPTVLADFSQTVNAIDASSLSFIYTPRAGGAGSIGRLDVRPSSKVTLSLQQISLGADNVLGGGDDTVTTLGTLGDYRASFTADVFYLGAANSYAVIGTYTITDSNRQVVLEGDFTSDSLSLGGKLLTIDGSLASLAAGGENFANTLGASTRGATTASKANVAMASLASSPSLFNLFQFQVAGSNADLDSLFSGKTGGTGSSFTVARSIPIVPVPGAALLGAIGLMVVSRFRKA
jgi:hypothetical protein